MKGHLSLEELEKYKKKDIQQLARELGVSDEGTIKEIAARCAAVEVDIPEESEAEQTQDVENPEDSTADQNAGSEEEPEADMTEVRVISRYLDLQLNQIKEPGDIFIVDRGRAECLVSEKVAEIVTMV